MDKRRKMLKRRFRRFWREWGFSKEDLEDAVGAFAIVLIPIGLWIIL